MGKVYTKWLSATSQKEMMKMNVGKVFAILPIALFLLFFIWFAVFCLTVVSWNLILLFQMILAVFSVALLVWGLVKYRQFRYGDAIKSRKREHEGGKNDELRPKRGQQLSRLCSAVVAESILQNNRKGGFDD